MIKIYVLIFLFFGTFFAFGQDEPNPNCGEPNKKAMKSIASAKRAPSLQLAVDFFNRAIEYDPDNATAYYEYGKFAYEQGTEYYRSQPTPAQGDRSYSTSEEYFKKAINKCDSFHCEIFYYLGIINYSQKDQEESKEWFEKFLAYDNPDMNRYPNEYPKMKKDVTELLKKWKEQDAIDANVVPFSPYKVPNVNSPTDEYFPMLSPDNELMFYTRKLDRRNLGDMVGNIVEEFTVSQRADSRSKFDSGVPFKKPFNDGSFKSYGAATMSVDNKEMVICACQETNVNGQDYLNCDLFQTKFTRTGKGGNDFNWTPLESLGPYINTPDGWEGQPSLSADGNTLYFTAFRKNTRDNDIFISKRGADGKWGIAVPFNEVNTAGKDKSPFIHQDDETFYFVSTCTETRKGAGGLDIFYMRKDANGKWGKPQNIGIPINSSDDELGLFVSTEGSIAYYSSRAGGDWGIYGFDLYLEARPESVVIVKGTLTDEEGNAMKDAEVELA
ncbi:MAG: tetratricopeptide repeat protein, partial [Bacteroidetes bacterium]|nr:tetratricopeptide repeat protein [Bacteroidota bacterium]